MRNCKLTALVALTLGIFLLTAATAMAAIEKTPKPRDNKVMINGESISASGDLIWTKQAAPGDTAWIRVHDDTRCDETGSPADGGQGTGLAPGYGTWCWEGGLLAPGVYDSCSSTTSYGGGLPGCFTHFDVYTMLTNKWHLDTLDRYLPADEDSTPWCGEFGDTLVWENPYGYGPQYNWSLILNLGTSGGGFNAADGFTVGGVHMYDVEINYDYCYLEYGLGNDVSQMLWFELARYNGTCNPEGVGTCPGTGGARYGCAQYDAFIVPGPAVNNSSNALQIRWRFASDSAWDDEDASGGVWTDGAWRVDHVYAKAVNALSNDYPAAKPYEDFENGLPAEWSTPTLPQAQLGGYWSGGVWVNGVPVICDWWHLEYNPNYTNLGNTCEYSNNWMWVADDEAFAQNQEDGYHYRLVSPVFECGENNPYWDPDGLGPGPDNRWSGVVVESDEYLCIKDIVGDVTDTQVRVYNSTIQRWSQWQGDDYVTVGGCQFWNVDQTENWSTFLGAAVDSIQFSWEYLDRCDYNSAGELPCMGQHRKATFIVDNISVGVFLAEDTQWSMGASQQFADTFARDVAMHSLFKENWELFPGDTWEQEDSLAIDVRDYNGVKGGPPPLNSGVRIHWRISTDCGQTWDKETSRPRGATAFPAVAWNEKVCNFSVPDDTDDQGTKAEFNGTYQTIITIAENSSYLGGGSLWPEGTVVEYFFTAMDSLDNRDTVPNRMALTRNSETLINTTSGAEHDRRLGWPFEVNVLPCPTNKVPLPVGQNHPVLLVDSYGRRTYDIGSDRDQTQTGTAVFPLVYQIYQESLDRLGIQYDFYRAGYGVSRGGGTGIYSQPFDHDGYGGVIDHRGALDRRYNSVIWFFGEFNSGTVLDSSQLEVATYIDRDGINFADSANLWILGDDLCEDELLTDPTWTNDQSVQTTNSAFFWQTLCGLTAVTGGCADDEGHGSLAAGYYYYLVGQAGTVLSGITKAAGYWDCPIRHHPDDDATVSTATPIMKYGDDLGPNKFCYSLQRHSNGSKVVLSFVGLELLGGPQERDCIAQAILGSGCFNVGIPNPKTTGCNINVGVDTDVPGLDRMVLRQNKPNPFNPTTTISFAIPNRTQVSLKIYDIAGREVRTLVNDVLDKDNYDVTWQGRDNNGNAVASGVYFYRLNAGKETATKKMVLLR